MRPAMTDTARDTYPDAEARIAVLVRQLAEAGEHIRKQADDIMTLGLLVYEPPEGDAPPVTWKDKAARLRERAEAAEARVAELEKALEFYADTSKYPAPFTGGFGELYYDCGQIARRALEGGE